MPRVTSRRTRGAPVTPAASAFALVGIGATSANPLGAGEVSTLYASPDILAEDYGVGDVVDVIAQAIAVTDDSPAPAPARILPTPASNPGAMGAIDTSSITTGRVSVTASAGAEPLGTYQPRVRVAVGGTVGVDGISLEASPDNGTTWLPAVDLGTDATFAIELPGPVPIPLGVEFDLALAPLVGTTNVTGSGLYGGGGTLDTKTLILTVDGGSPTTLTLAGGSNAANQAALLAAIHSTWPTITATVASTHLVLTDSTATGSIVVGAGTANALLGLTAGTYAPTLAAGDEWSCTTTPPTWDAGDIFTAGATPTGALAELAEADAGVGVIVITEPIATTQALAAVSAGLDYLATYGKRPAVIGRFRPPNVGETEPQYIAACNAFCAANHDERVTLTDSTPGLMTDALRGYVYARSGLAAVAARINSFEKIKGLQGERLAQHPGWVARGPLPGFTIMGARGKLVGHDEAKRPGIAGPVAGRGGMLTFYYQRRDVPRGTYVFSAPTLYPNPSTTCETFMDQRVLGAMQVIAEGIAWTSIGGASVFSPPVNGVATLDDGVRLAMAADIAGAIKTDLASEFQNAEDPGLVSVNPTVTVAPEGKVTVSGKIRPRLYGWNDAVDLEFSATR